MTYIIIMIFIETSIFERRLSKILTDDEYRLLQEHLIIDSEAGDEIPHTKGIRKIRWVSKGHGKRGGCRVIYYWFSSRDQIHFLMSYGKNEQDDLTAEQLKIIKKVIDEEYKGEYHR